MRIWSYIIIKTDNTYYTKYITVSGYWWSAHKENATKFRWFIWAYIKAWYTKEPVNIEKI